MKTGKHIFLSLTWVVVFVLSGVTAVVAAQTLVHGAASEARALALKSWPTRPAQRRMKR